MPTTTNFGWTTPADTDLVKDGASAMRTLAGGIDTSMAQLKGGTTGQILSKTSNTDMAFTWITPNPGDITSVGVSSPITGGGTSGDVTISIQDASTTQKGAVQLTDSTSSTSTTTAATPNSVKTAYDLANAAIAKSLVDAKGDLIVATADNTVARQAVGTNNQIIVADSAQTNGLKWANGSIATLTTKGDLLGASAANTLARVAVGTDGQVLTADAASTAGVKWTTVATGAYTSLASGTLNTGQSTLTLSSISGSYTDLYLVLRQSRPATTMTVNSVTSYAVSFVSNSSPYADTNRANVLMYYNSMTTTDVGNVLVIKINDYANTTGYKVIEFSNWYNAVSAGLEFTWGKAISKDTSAITSITVNASANWSTAGSYVLYGVK